MLTVQKQIRRLLYRRKAAVMKTAHGWLADQNQDIETLWAKQLAKLNVLLNHAYSNVPYYHSLFDRGNLAAGNKIKLKKIEDLRRIPILTKKILKDNFDNLVSSDHVGRKSFKNASGGSTGVPVEVMQDRQYLISDEACLVQLKNWRGVDPYDSEIFIWGSERDTFEGRKPYPSYISDFLRNRMVVNSFRLTEEDIRRYIKLLNRHKPKMIRAYVDAAYEIARYSRLNNIKIESQNLVHTGAGTLFDHMREEIEQAFGCKIFNQYGGREVGSIASECSAHDGMHIQMEHNLVEIIDNTGQPCQPGEEGKIIVTNLNNYSMPIIRYEIGDVGIMQDYSKCDCECGYPKLKKVIGRTGDLFHSSDGRTVSPLFFAHLLGVVVNDGSIKKYQAVQKSSDKITIKLVENGQISNEIKDEIKSKIKSAMGESCTIEIETVPDILPTPSGKYRYTINEVKKN